MSTTQQSAAPRHTRPGGWTLYPVIYAAAAYVAALVVPLQPWAFLAVGCAVGGFGALAVRVLFPAGTYGRQFTASASWCAGLAGISAGFWMLLAAPRPWPLVGWLCLWFAVFGPWFYVMAIAAPRVARAADAAHAGPQSAVAGGVPPEQAREFPAILAAAQIDDAVRLTRVTTSPSGGVETLHLRPVREPGKKAITYRGFVQHLDDVTAAGAAVLEDSRGIDLDDDDVVPERGRNASEFLLHFTVKRVHEGNLDYLLRDAPVPATEPLTIGWFEDDRPIELIVCHPDDGARHIDIVGKAGSGKSVVIANLIAELLSSDQREVWVVGTEKVVKLVWGWMVPWLRGECERPPIDWVGGEDVYAALDTLEAAVEFGKVTNAMHPAADTRPAARGKAMLTVIIDESSKLLSRKEKGRRTGKTASALVAEAKALGRSALLEIVIANQDQLFGSFGDSGPAQQRNTHIGIALQTQRRDDADKVLASLPRRPDASKLRNKQFYVATGEADERGLRGKACSLRADDIPAVAAQVARWRYGLDPAVTDQLPFYADRWNPARHPALVDAARANGMEWPVSVDHPGDRPEPAARPPAGAHPLPAGEPPARDRVTPAGGGAGEHPEAGADVTLSPGWDDDARLWAELLGEEAGAPGDQGESEAPARVGDEPPGPPPAGGGYLPPADTSGIEAAGRRLVEAFRERAARSGRPPLPEPLGLVMVAVEHPDAPEAAQWRDRGWVPTLRLAEVLGRVARDADDMAKRRAAEQLGRDLSALDPDLTPTEPRRVGKQRLRGFLVEDLRAAAQRLSRGAA